MNVKDTPPEIRLERLVDALSEELADAADLEILDAAADLRMELTMRGSAAFLGLKALYFPYRPEKFAGLSESRGHDKPAVRRPEKS